MGKRYKAPPLVDRKQLEAVIDNREDLTKAQVDFLKGRWLHQIVYWDRRSRSARRKHFALRLVTVVGGVSIPVLTMMRTEGREDQAVIVAVVAALIAACAAWEGIANYTQIWLEKRRAAELLKVEGWLFLYLAEKYSEEAPGGAFPRFVAEVERIIAKEVGEYVGFFDPSADPLRKKPADSESISSKDAGTSADGAGSIEERLTPPQQADA